MQRTRKPWSVPYLLIARGDPVDHPSNQRIDDSTDGRDDPGFLRQIPEIHANKSLFDGFDHRVKRGQTTIKRSRLVRQAVLEVILQDYFIILTTVEYANDRNPFGVHVKGNHSALLVVGNA